MNGSGFDCGRKVENLMAAFNAWAEMNFAARPPGAGAIFGI